jgi:phytanoyl-CoA hydroxylase
MTDQVLDHLRAHGWARLGVRLDPAGCAALRAAADALMLGAAPVDGIFYQHDSATGAYEDLVYGQGWVGPSPSYRKLEKLERVSAFRTWIEDPRLEPVVRAVIPGDVALYRAVLWTKAAAGGMDLPWHQDGGRFWGLDRQPELTVWTALDDAPAEAGCVEVIDGSHAGGLATAEGGTIPATLTAPVEADALPLPVVAGEVLLLHNLVWHRSRRNRTGQPRRALSVCYMPAQTRCTRKRDPRRFVRVFQVA